MSNKYQLLYCIIMFAAMGCFIQKNLLTTLKNLIMHKKMMIVLTGAVLSAFLPLIRNFLITGDPFFPVLAGRLNSFGWTTEQEKAYSALAGGLSPFKFFKFSSFFFIWPGIQAAKYVWLVILGLPMIILSSLLFKRFDEEPAKFMAYWLMLSFLTVLGTALGSFIDPRYFRYGIMVLSFTAITSFFFILRNCFNVKNMFITNAVVLALAVPGYKIMFSSGTDFQRPTFKENMNVLFNRIHTDYALAKHYPKVQYYKKTIERSDIDLSRLAYHSQGVRGAPLFFMPTRPIVGLYRSTVVNWHSYEKTERIEKDLEKYGIQWLFQFQDKEGIIITSAEYAQKAVLTDRFPDRILTHYGFPDEIRRRD